MRTIVCNFNLFDAQQMIYVINADGKTEKIVGYATFDYMAPILVSACEQYNTNRVHLIGDKTYAQKIIEATKEAEEIAYGKSKIEIEVN